MIHLKEITEPTRLEEYYRFRYEIYKNSAQARFLKDDSGIDKDIYDDEAIHLGWYENGVLKGCVRLIRPINHKDSLFAFSHMPIDVRIKAETFMRRFTMDNKPFVEVSRICIAPEKRNLHTVTQFVQATITESTNYGLEQALFTCDKPHVRYWLHHGFQLLEGTGSWNCTTSGTHPSYCLTYEKKITKAPNTITDKLLRTQQVLSPQKNAA